MLPVFLDTCVLLKPYLCDSMLTIADPRLPRRLGPPIRLGSRHAGHVLARPTGLGPGRRPRRTAASGLPLSSRATDRRGAADHPWRVGFRLPRLCASVRPHALTASGCLMWTGRPAPDGQRPDQRDCLRVPGVRPVHRPEEPQAVAGAHGRDVDVVAVGDHGRQRVGRPACDGRFEPGPGRPARLVGPAFGSGRASAPVRS